MLCTLINFLKRESMYVLVGRWAPCFLQKHSLCDMDCKKDTALCVRYRQGLHHPGQQGHRTPRCPNRKGLLPSCKECSHQVTTAVSSFRVCFTSFMPSWDQWGRYRSLAMFAFRAQLWQTVLTPELLTGLAVLPWIFLAVQLPLSLPQALILNPALCAGIRFQKIQPATVTECKCERKKKKV